VTVTTGSYANEVSWQIESISAAGAIVCASSQTYNDDAEYSSECCLGPGVYNLICLDSWGDGWNGGDITVGNVSYCSGASFSMTVESITVSSPTPSPTPAPTPAETVEVTAESLREAFDDALATTHVFDEALEHVFDTALDTLNQTALQ
jgi:hypothetical protein